MTAAQLQGGIYRPLANRETILSGITAFGIAGFVGLIVMLLMVWTMLAPDANSKGIGPSGDFSNRFAISIKKEFRSPAGVGVPHTTLTLGIEGSLGPTEAVELLMTDSRGKTESLGTVTKRDMIANGYAPVHYSFVASGEYALTLKSHSTHRSVAQKTIFVTVPSPD